MPKQSIVRTLRLNTSDWSFFQTILTRGTPNPSLEKGVVASYRVDFGKGVYAEIEFANYEEAPCVMAVLKDKVGIIARLDNRFKLLGEYRFSTDGPDYVIRAVKSRHGAVAAQFV